MPKSTDERIIAAHSPGARVADILALIADIEAEATSADAEANRLDALSLDHATPEPQAEAAADEAGKVRRRAKRLAAKVTALRARIDDLEESNRSIANRAAYDAAKERRDALASDLKARWPALVAEMVEMFDRIAASDAECAKVRGPDDLVSAEAIARDCHPNFILPGLHQYIPRLSEVKVYGLDASTSQAITYGVWPKHVPLHVL
jgi:hypothetical protein